MTNQLSTIIEDYKAGVSIRDLAAWYGVDQGWLRRAITTGPDGRFEAPETPLPKRTPDYSWKREATRRPWDGLPVEWVKPVVVKKSLKPTPVKQKRRFVPRQQRVGLPEPAVLVQMRLDGMLLKEIGDKYGYTRERIRQITVEAGYDEAKAAQDKAVTARVLALHNQGLSASAIARESDLGDGLVRGILKSHDLQPNGYQVDPIGCDKCEAKPYARGLCKRCYNRARKAGTLEQYENNSPTKGKWAASKRRKIGCKKCKTDHFARGLCRSCYYAARAHGILDQYPPVTKRGRRKASEAANE